MYLLACVPGKPIETPGGMYTMNSVLDDHGGRWWLSICCWSAAWMVLAEMVPVVGTPWRT
jgi:hypothetical protein